jgi:hypothetical protein
MDTSAFRGSRLQNICSQGRETVICIRDLSASSVSQRAPLRLPRFCLAVCAVASLWTLLYPTHALGQGQPVGTAPPVGFQGGGATPPPPEPPPPPPPSDAKSAGAVDLSGYWVSIIADDARFYVTPMKGDIDYLPINDEAKKIAREWDPDKDVATGHQCRAYGAVGVMQQPGRLHITWADPNTLRVEADAGTQTRLLRFGKGTGSPQPASLQGYSVAQWEGNGRAMRGQRTPQDSVKVLTRNMIPGYIRKNGVPYSGDAVLTEYFDVVQGGPENATYLIDLAIVDDPKYLTEPYYKSHIFKKVADGKGWDPTPCWPR